MLICSFKGVFAKAPLSRAVASAGPDPGKKRGGNAEQWLKDKSHSYRRARNKLFGPICGASYLTTLLHSMDWWHMFTQTVSNHNPLTFTLHAVRQS